MEKTQMISNTRDTPILKLGNYILKVIDIYIFLEKV